MEKRMGGGIKKERRRERGGEKSKFGEQKCCKNRVMGQKAAVSAVSAGQPCLFHGKDGSERILNILQFFFSRPPGDLAAKQIGRTINSSKSNFIQLDFECSVCMRLYITPIRSHPKLELKSFSKFHR